MELEGLIGGNHGIEGFNWRNPMICSDKILQFYNFLRSNLLIP
jgi:hypothetical protein